MLWLIACVNGTSLMLARSTIRQREIAVRGALGASRWRIVQQLAIEGLVLSAIASALGLGLAMLMLKLFEHGLTQQFHIHENMAANLTVIGLLAALTIVSALLCSVWPALIAAKVTHRARPAAGWPAKQLGRSAISHPRLARRLQIAMSLILLVGCGLLLRTIYALRHVPLGFRTDHIIVANMTIPAFQFAGQNMTTELYQPLVDRANHIPGVQSASLMTAVPLGTTFKMQFTFSTTETAPPRFADEIWSPSFAPSDRRCSASSASACSKEDSSMKHDTASSQPVVVVNQAFAKAIPRHRPASGKDSRRKSLLNLTKTRHTVVIGVIDDERQVSIVKQSQPEIESASRRSPQTRSPTRASKA